MTRQEITDSIDAATAQVLAPIGSAQANYLAGNGRYAQMLQTHTVTPADGASVAPDNGSARPYYQSETVGQLATLVGLPATMQACAWCDTYEGPQGPGYVLYLEVIIAGVTWRRQINVGPEDWQTRGWYGLGLF